MQLISTEDKISRKISQVAASADELPAIVTIHNIQKEFAIEYMSKRGLDILGLTLEELINMKTEYHSRYFNVEENKEYIPRIKDLIDNNSDSEILPFFQQVRPSENHDWKWYSSTLKILMRDDNGFPLLAINISIPIDSTHHISLKVSRLLEENNFLRKNSDKFHSLSQREKLVLKELALGKSSGEIAGEMHISSLTVDTHRKNIKKKLGTHSTYELAEYARAFNLL